MEKIIDVGTDLEVKVGETFIAWWRCENPKRFSVCRGEKYVEMRWNELTLEEQIAVEKFN